MIIFTLVARTLAIIAALPLVACFFIANPSNTLLFTIGCLSIITAIAYTILATTDLIGPILLEELHNNKIYFIAVGFWLSNGFVYFYAATNH